MINIYRFYVTTFNKKFLKGPRLIAVPNGKKT